MTSQTSIFVTSARAVWNFVTVQHPFAVGLSLLGIAAAAVLVSPERQTRWGSRWWVVAIVLSGLAALWCGWQGSDAKAAEMGEYVGGTLAFATVALLVWSLREQQKASNTRAQETRVREVEERFYLLLRLHRDNVEEMRLSGSQGREVFRQIRAEFQAAHCALSSALPNEVDGPNRVRIANDWVYLSTDATKTQFEWPDCFHEESPSSVEIEPLQGGRPLQGPRISALRDWLAGADLTSGWRRALQVYGAVLNGEPNQDFQGQQERLGHYYRHLFQAVSYVDRQSDNVLSRDDKYGYVKMLRAQLSSDEQVLLLINSLTPRGKDWWKGGEDSLMVKYKLVSNIPEEVFKSTGDYGTTLLEQFEDVESYTEGLCFEWQVPVEAAGG